jgi:DNA-binding response OmpR family regulator
VFALPTTGNDRGVTAGLGRNVFNLLPRQFRRAQFDRQGSMQKGVLSYRSADEILIQSLVEETLSDGGFEPAIATSGEEAVNLLKAENGKYRALVTDIHLKGKMDGWEVAQHAREIEPEFPIVYMSGAAATEWTSKGVPNSVMLSKPFAPAQLLTAIANLLNSGTPTT